MFCHPHAAGVQLLEGSEINQLAFISSGCSAQVGCSLLSTISQVAIFSAVAQG